MTTMQKFKAYFGMVPPAEYEDDYLDDVPLGPRPTRGSFRSDDYRDDDYRVDDYRGESYGDKGFHDDDVRGYRGEDYPMDDYRDDYRGAPEPAYTYAPRHSESRHGEPIDRPRSARLEPLQRSSGAPMRPTSAGRAPAQADQQELDGLFADGPLHKITTLRPSDYSEARTIGERYRDGSPVIMDLVDMSNDDAKRLVDFAAGLAFALRGSFDKVATKVFLLSPADVDVSPEDRRKIAASGFYNHS